METGCLRLLALLAAVAMLGLPAEAWAAPEVTFTSSAPSVYQQGSGQSIGFNVSGTMPRNGNVLVLAWSDAEKRMVNEFAHVMTSGPWQVSADKLDKLPAGLISLQLIVRVPGESNELISHEMQVRPKPEPVVTVPDVSFSSPPSSYQQGSGQPIGVSVDGAMPEGGNVLAIAWSESEKRMVNEFAHEMKAGPWQIPAAKLDVLPAGRTIVQLLVRVPGHDHVKISHNLDVLPKPEPVVTVPDVSFSSTPSSYQQGSGQAIGISVDGTMPEGGDVLVLAWSDSEKRMVNEFAHELKSSPWQVSASKLDTLPAGRTVLQLLVRVPGHDHVKISHNLDVLPKPEPVVTLPQVSFSSPPSTYQQGSGQAIGINVNGTMPKDGNILVIAWSSAEGRMVNEFAHELRSAPWQVSASKLDMLPAGRTSLQLLVRAPGQDNVQVAHMIEIYPLTNPSPGDGGEDPGTGDPGDGDGDGDGGTTDPGTDPGDGDDNGSDPGDGGMVTTGWTELKKASDTQVVYVSTSEGNDKNSGLSADQPVRSLSKAYQLMRSGRPDWMALKRGDTFQDAWPQWSKSGRSESAPMVITGYGEGPRPRIAPSGINRPFMKVYDANVRHLWFVGLDFYNIHADPNSSQYNRSKAASEALVFRGPGGDVLIEDCKFSFFVQSFIIEAGDGIQDVRFRRNVVVDAHTTGGSHALGGFLRLIDGLVVEGNVFDHNGWSEQVRGADPTIFRHNLYLKECKDVVIRDNIFANGASFGLKISSDHRFGCSDYVIEKNLIVGNANGLTIGHSASSADFAHRNYVIRDNVFSALGRSISGGDPQAYGMAITTIENATVERNFFVHKTIGARQPAIDIEKNTYHRDVRVANNVVHNWVTINGKPDVVITEGSHKTNVTSSGNLVEISASRYSDAKRTVQTYNASIGGQASIAAFMKEARQQRKGYYREKYTAAKVTDYIRSGYTLLPMFD